MFWLVRTAWGSIFFPHMRRVPWQLCFSLCWLSAADFDQCWLRTLRDCLTMIWPGIILFGQATSNTQDEEFCFSMRWLSAADFDKRRPRTLRDCLTTIWPRIILFGRLHPLTQNEEFWAGWPALTTGIITGFDHRALTLFDWFFISVLGLFWSGQEADFLAGLTKLIGGSLTAVWSLLTGLVRASWLLLTDFRIADLTDTDLDQIGFLVLALILVGHLSLNSQSFDFDFVYSIQNWIFSLCWTFDIYQWSRLQR